MLTTDFNSNIMPRTYSETKKKSEFLTKSSHGNYKPIQGSCFSAHQCLLWAFTLMKQRQLIRYWMSTVHRCSIYLQWSTPTCKYRISRAVRRTMIVSLDILEKNNDECILILVIYWKKTELVHTKISNHNIIYSS